MEQTDLFWDQPEFSLDNARGGPIRSMPPIPDLGWKTPKEFPNLSSASVISIDIETYDPELIDYGPGWGRGKGHIVGVAIAVPEARWYFPMRHEVRTEDNLDPEKVLKWLKDTLGNEKQYKIGANILYDYGFLKQEGVEIKGQLIDVQYAEALLDDRAKVGLDTLGQKYLGIGKDGSILYNWCADYYGGKPNDKQRANIYRAPPSLVGPYAEMDVELPLKLAPILYKKLAAENLTDLFHTECKLIPLLAAMRFRGVKVDVEKAEQLRPQLLARAKIEQDKLNNLVGFPVNVMSGAEIAKAFDKMGLEYSRTEAGNPSFTKNYLESLNNPVANLIKEIRRLDKIRSTFIESYILDSHVNGRIHGQFHPLRHDEGGTMSGRFASSQPNLQNISARDEELAPLIRGLFVPDNGLWRKFDYSQIEYRFLVHYAVGQGSEEARRMYCDNPKMDYHDYTMDMVIPYAGWDVSTPEKRKHKRRPLKNINFGLVYGMGEAKLAGDLGMSLQEGKKLFQFYHKALPFVKATMQDAVNVVNRNGFIDTILGRRARFDLWEPEGYGHESPPLPYTQAVVEYGGIKRAYTHKAINNRLQGSSADLIKTAMLKAWESGLFDYLGVPYLTVHDELDMDDDGTKDDGFAELQHIMETAIPLSIPIRVECEIGPDWGHTK